MNKEDLFSARKSLDQICNIPDKIISVYSLEKHVWADSNSQESRCSRKPELKTIEEFQIDPVRPFLNDIFRNIAAPYKRERRDNPIGQGYWIQAEFGSGKSHLLCFLASLALGRADAWNIVKNKEEQTGRGKRESLFRFWEEGIKAKSSDGTKGLFVVVKTLVGAGGGTVGVTDKGQRLSEYILTAVKDQLQVELGKNVSLYPTELLADRFIKQDLDRYRNDLKKFLRNSQYFDEDEFEDVDDFIRDIQQNKSPEYKLSCGTKLWRFYTEYLKVRPDIAAETEDILNHMVEVILAEGYSGILLILDEVSLFMKNRDEAQRIDDEKTLVVLSNRLAKIHNLPIWTVCAAQQAIESKMGVKNIIADDRLKLVKLLEEEKDYYDIVLARVREIKDAAAIGNYYLHYKRGFTWPNSIGESDFRHFFPFHKPAIEVLRAITYELTTTRSAIHFMHQTLKNQIKKQGTELIRLWELFDETVRYEEDPSGVHAGLVAIKTKKEEDYRAYESCRNQIDGMTKGLLKVNRDKAVRTIQTLFLYHIAKTRQQGIEPEEIANSVMIERSADATPDENIQHYESLSENLRKELRQVVQSLDEDGKPRYKFDPVFAGVDPRTEFQKACDDVESNEVVLSDAWNALLAMDEWIVQTRQMKMDLANSVQSIFHEVAPANDRSAKDLTLEIMWQGRVISGIVGMRDFATIVQHNSGLPPIRTDDTENDFAVYIGIRHVEPDAIDKLIKAANDPRIIFWNPDSRNTEETERLIRFAAYRKLVTAWAGKDSEDAVTIINWISNNLQTELGNMVKVVQNSFGRGRIDTQKNSQIEFRVAGELKSIITPVVAQILEGVYESRNISFSDPLVFRKEEGVKVINGIVKTGQIPKGAKPNQNTSAAQNFGYSLNIIRKGPDKVIDTSSNTYIQEIFNFVDQKLVDDGQTMPFETLYKNFMGIGGPKDFGLTKRMVQIFVLCLVREGKMRIGLSAKAGLSVNTIDYANIADIEFSAKILDSLDYVQKMVRSENWEILRPYAEAILGEEIRPTQDESYNAQIRESLRKEFQKQDERTKRIFRRTVDLFKILNIVNPYENIISKLVKLFSASIEGTNDVDLILQALEDGMDYTVFSQPKVSQTEVDDLKSKLQCLSMIERFLEFERELVTLSIYVNNDFGKSSNTESIRKIISKVNVKFNNIKTYIDDDIALRTELIGSFDDPQAAEETLAGIVREYLPLYSSIHDQLVQKADLCLEHITNLQNGIELQTIQMLDNVAALTPPQANNISAFFNSLKNGLFNCQDSSRSSIENELCKKPIHSCGLQLTDAELLLDKINTIDSQAAGHVKNVLMSRIEVLLSESVRNRLMQGMDDPSIKSIVECKTPDELLPVLFTLTKTDSGIAGKINRYLKKIVLKRISLKDFKPAISTIEKGQVDLVTREFRTFLEQQFNTTDDEQDSLPMLQFE
jgi:hypothetical protein